MQALSSPGLCFRSLLVRNCSGRGAIFEVVSAVAVLAAGQTRSVAGRRASPVLEKPAACPMSLRDRDSKAETRQNH